MNLLEDKNKKLLEKKLHEYAIDIKSELIHISFLLSFSGGLDSMVMFEELIRIRKKYPFILGLAHINHNMHNQSKKMENFCKKVARKNNIPIYVDNLQFPSKKNFESTARKLRYRFLNKVSKKYFYNFILTAHHKDDQLETIFMKEMEGGDWTSKIGIREKNKNIRRPFLDVFKKDIVLYAENKQLLWIEDPSNKDISFKRNNIRHIVFPNAVKNDVSLIKTLINIRKDSIKKMNLSLLKIDSSIASMLKKTSLTSLRLDRNMLKIFTPEELKILIYRCIVKKINTKFTNRTYGFWTQFYIFIKESRTGAEFLIDKMLFLSNRNFIDVICDYEEKNKLEKIKLINGVRWLNTKFEVQDIQNMSVSENRHIFLLSPSIYNKGLHIRQWKNGDRILSSTSGKSILLSNLFINNKLSKYEKYIQPIITNGKDEILWIPGMLHREGNLQFKSKNKVIRWIEN